MHTEIASLAFEVKSPQSYFYFSKDLFSDGITFGRIRVWHIFTKYVKMIQTKRGRSNKIALAYRIIWKELFFKSSLSTKIALVFWRIHAFFFLIMN